MKEEIKKLKDLIKFIEDFSLLINNVIILFEV